MVGTLGSCDENLKSMDQLSFFEKVDTDQATTRLEGCSQWHRKQRWG